MAIKKIKKDYAKINKKILDLILNIHERNKKRIKHGIIFLAILPIILVIIRALTDGDKIVFLIIWIITIFITAIYLISIEYLDEIIKKELKDLTNKDLEFDSLIENKKLKEFHNFLNKGGTK